MISPLSPFSPFTASAPAPHPTGRSSTPRSPLMGAVFTYTCLLVPMHCHSFTGSHVSSPLEGASVPHLPWIFGSSGPHCPLLFMRMVCALTLPTSPPLLPRWLLQSLGFQLPYPPEGRFSAMNLDSDIWEFLELLSASVSLSANAWEDEVGARMEPCCPHDMGLGAISIIGSICLG